MQQQAFVPNPERKFTKDVVWRYPTENGTFRPVTQTCNFKSIPKARVKAMREDPDFDDEDLLREVLEGVSPVGDGDGGVLEPKDGVEPMLTEESFVYEAAMTYYDAKLGGNLKGKTSKRQRGTG